ncbi:hypothetical protein PR048_027592 [Dryococelus australis]|uniref:Integrase catalytic domain-containing protein n=1 Tax=Dryococelus australis TaxID=614101 RepID=A0ABQ9GGZ6_9NEOP|nr:hypothetical protein PR048_027592 [Dryococelus australis]
MVIGEQAWALLTSLITPKELFDVSYEELIQVLNSHFDPKKNEIASCFVFANRKQQPTETIAEFVAELKRLSRGCNFQDLEKQLLIRIVCGVKYERLQHQLLSESNLTFDMAVKISAAFEVANRNGRLFQLHRTRLNMFAKEVVANGERARRVWVCEQYEKCKTAGHIKRVCRSSSSTRGTKAKKSEVYYTDFGRVRREYTRVNEDHYGTLFNVNLSIDQQNAFPLPTIKELWVNLGCSEVFSQLDVKQAYFQLPVDDPTAEILTLSTSKGLMRVRRLPQGLLAVPGIFQNFMEQLWSGLQGVAVFLDDIVISGSMGMILNKGKCKFRVPQVRFLGIIVNKAGVQPVGGKVRAIHEAPEPKNKTELKVFLGLLNFYDSTLKGKAHIAEPLHRLLKENTTWNFGPTEREVFKNCKTLLQTTSVLAYYDEHKPLVLTNGHWRLLPGPCWTLNYGQFDKEDLALVYGVNKFQKYLLGRTFTIFSDHKPLLGVFDQVGCHYQRWWKTPHHPADILFLESEDAPYNAIEIAATTEANSSLWTVKTWIENGRVNLKNCQTLSVVGKFKTQFNEVSLSRGCILWSNPVVIPQHLQDPILEELHAHHPGIVAMKNQLCQQTRHSRQAVQSSFWTRSTYKWQWLHIDFLGPLQGQNFLIVVDAYTKWLEIIPTRSMTLGVIVSILRNIFAMHGLPECVVSDNEMAFSTCEHLHTIRQAMAWRKEVSKRLRMQCEGYQARMWIVNYLLMQRNTPRLSTGKSLAELLAGRRKDDGKLVPSGKLHPPPHRLLPLLPSAAHAGNDCPLAMEEGTGREDDDQSPFLGFPEERSEYNTFTEEQQKGTTRGELLESRSKELPFDGAPSPILRHSQRAGVRINSRYNDFV